MTVNTRHGEINRDFYCSYHDYPGGRCLDFFACGGSKRDCRYLRHKWPTREQFMEEYGKEYPDNGAVYCLVYTNTFFTESKKQEWRGYDGGELHNLMRTACDDLDLTLVCACAPFGKPPDNWRPE